jgi:hypothetical protein
MNMKHGIRFRVAAVAVALAILATFSSVPVIQAAGSDTTIIRPVAGSFVYNQRFRTSIANVNTGVTLLPAVAGYKYRMIDASMIAVGGAVATCTAVVINGTQATSSVALLSVAVAALTQSTVVKPNTANATVLADGASYVKNDVATAVTLGKTGGSCATATSVDVILSYAIES